MSEFHKFPHTPHLLWLGPGTPRDDKILSSDQVAEFLSGEVIVEEKVDGANVGISIGPDGRVRLHNRGNYLSPGRSHPQWNIIWPWLAERCADMEEGLRSGLILYGEWCYARHSVPYDSLPDWFLGFDVFEISSRRFWSVDRRNAWLNARGLASVPEIQRGWVQPEQIASLIGNSKVGHAPMEGVYLRREHAGGLLARAKVVSAVFKQQIEDHWTRRPTTANQIAMAHT